MSNYLPDLEHDLRAAIRSGAHHAEQPVSKRRRRLATTVIVAFAASVALAVGAVALVLRGESHSPKPGVVRGRSHRPAPIAGGHARIDQAFAAFRRPRAASDVLSPSELLLLRISVHQLRLDVRESRLVFASPTLSLWLLPGSRASARLCLLQTETSGSGGGGLISCHANPRLPFTSGLLRVARGVRAKPGSRRPPRRPTLGPTVIAVVPESITAVRVKLVNGASDLLRPNANGAVVHAFPALVRSTHFVR
jgi:hypothetical protein